MADDKMTTTAEDDAIAELAKMSWEDLEILYEDNKKEVGKDERVLVEDKTKLVGVPMWITGVEYRDGDYGNQFVSVEATIPGGHKIVFNDGGTGVMAQIDEHLKEKKPIPFKAASGLRVSEYGETKEGKKVDGQTFYLTGCKNLNDLNLNAIRALNNPAPKKKRG